MFAHALVQGGLRPAEALPPTLTPNAIFAMAPPAPRRLGFLGACVVYAGCTLALTLAPSLNVRPGLPPVTERGGAVPQDPTKVPSVELRTVPPPRPTGLTARTAPPRDADWRPPTPIDEVPAVAPTTLPTVNRGFDSVAQGDPASPAHAIPGMPTTSAMGSEGSLGTVVEVEYHQMRLLAKVDPVYPVIARMARIQGDVVLHLTVDERGVPTEVRALSGPHPTLGQEAMRVARLWRFEPARMNGQPVAAQFRLTLQFRLR